jgi:hypothetical protein
MPSLFELLPLEILDMVCSFLKAEDILMLFNTLPMVKHCPRYKRLIGKTIQFNQMWDEIAEYRHLHEKCIHVCLPQITVNPHHDYDTYLENTDEMLCYYEGRGIFCLASNDLKAEIDPRYDKSIVPLKKHIHCNCEMIENKENPCDVHEDLEEYEESISFANRCSDGGYVEVKDTDVEILPTVQIDKSVSIELTQCEIEQLFEEF